MGLFSRNYNKPGPGIPKDAPRKKGIARFFELLGRDFSDFVKLSLLFSLTALPSAAAFVIGVLPFMLGQSEIILLFVFLSLLLAYPIGGALVACYFNITRLMRDDPSYIWYDFKRKFKENYKQAAPIGIICAAFVYTQIILLLQFVDQTAGGGYPGGLLWLTLSVMSLLLFLMITPYIFMHFAYIGLGTLQVLKNSFLMTLAYLPRSLMGAICGNIIWALFLLLMPASLVIMPLVPLFLVSLSMHLTLSWVWPPFEKIHKIEETLNKMRG